MCRKLNIEQLQTTTIGWQYGSCRPGDSCYLPEYNGNITNRSYIGDHAYTRVDACLHAVMDITDAAGTLLQGRHQSMSYTPFNKVSHISQSGYDYFISYGSDLLRRSTSLHTGIVDNVLLTKHYAFGDYEKEVTQAGTRHLHYLQGGDTTGSVNGCWVWPYEISIEILAAAKCAGLAQSNPYLGSVATSLGLQGFASRSVSWVSC